MQEACKIIMVDILGSMYDRNVGYPWSWVIHRNFIRHVLCEVGVSLRCSTVLLLLKQMPVAIATIAWIWSSEKVVIIIIIIFVIIEVIVVIVIIVIIVIVVILVMVTVVITVVAVDIVVRIVAIRIFMFIIVAMMLIMEWSD